MPNVYLTGGTTGATLGAAVAIAANSNIVAIGSMTGDVVVGTGGAVNDGRKPVTVVVKIPLGTSTTTVSALWAGTRNTTVNTDTFASLSALLLSN
jgi:hypothetical protein